MSLNRRILPAVSADRIAAVCYDLALSDMTFQTEMIFEHRLDQDRLCRALELLFHALPILGCRFTPRFWQPCWEQVPWSPEGIYTVTKDQGRLEQFKREKLPERAGPQVHLCLYSDLKYDQLVVKCSHQVSDGRRFNHVLHTLSSIYTRLAAEPGFIPQQEVSYRGSRELFKRIPLKAWPRIFKNTLRNMIEDQTACLALQQPEGPDTHACHVLRHLPAQRVGALRDYARSRNATINDMLLAAYFRTQTALTDWSGQSDLRICYLVDLQPWKKPGQAGFAVTNMVGLELISLGRTLGTSFDDTLRLVNAATVNRKQDWCGLNQICFIPLWKYLPFRLQTRVLTSLMRGKLHKGACANILSNVGTFPATMMQFDLPPLRAWNLAPSQRPPALLLDSTTYNGEMTLTSSISASARPFVEKIFDRFIAELPA